MYNSPNHPDFGQHMMTLHDMCRARQMSYSLRYDEDQALWYVHIDSCVPSECHFGHDHSLGLALEEAIEHLAGVPICK